MKSRYTKEALRLEVERSPLNCRLPPLGSTATKLLRSAQRSVLCALLVLAVLANEATARTFKFVTIAGPPFGLTDPTGKPSGINFEVGNRIGDEAGLLYENVILPYARALAMIESGMADFMIAYPNERLERAATPIVNIASLENVVVGVAGTTFPNLEHLHGKTVATVRGAKYDDGFSADPEIKKYLTNNYDQSLSMLLAGRVDAVIGMRIGFLYAIKARGGSHLQLGEPLVLNKSDALLYFANSSYDELTASRVKQAFARLQQRKVIQRIEFRYFGTTSASVP